MPEEGNPYVGPRPFERRHAALFFGRDREVNELVSLIISHTEVLLYSQSGAGKSSLVNARLIPLWKRKGSTCSRRHECRESSRALTLPRSATFTPFIP